MSWVAGADRCSQLSDPRLNPGMQLLVRPELDNPSDSRALAIWTKDRQLKAGYVPRVIRDGLSHSMATRFGVVLWEEGPSGRRTGLGVLLTRQQVELVSVEVSARATRALTVKTNQYRQSTPRSGAADEVDLMEQMRRMLDSE